MGYITLGGCKVNVNLKMAKKETEESKVGSRERAWVWAGRWEGLVVFSVSGGMYGDISLLLRMVQDDIMGWKEHRAKEHLLE